jgi:hypothetical protein
MENLLKYYASLYAELPTFQSFACINAISGEAGFLFRSQEDLPKRIKAMKNWETHIEMKLGDMNIVTAQPQEYKGLVESFSEVAVFVENTKILGLHMNIIDSKNGKVLVLPRLTSLASISLIPQNIQEWYPFTLAIVDFCNTLLTDCCYCKNGTITYALNKNVKEAWNILYAQTYVLWDVGHFLEVTWKDSPLEGALPQQPEMDKLACLERKMAHPKYDTYGTDNPLSLSRLTLYY